MTAPTLAPSPEDTAAAWRGRRRVLLAPVTVTPTKPLNPSHIKGLLWTDVMYKATRRLADVTYRYSHTTYHQTEQTLGFWEHLDRTLGDADYSSLTEEQIGELYVGYRSTAWRAPAAALRPYAEAVEHGWVHPASVRVLELWSRHYAELGMHDPGLLRYQPPAFGLEEMVAALEELGLCLDQRTWGGPVYLDVSGNGLPLRQIIGADGRPNYLACALRELMPLAPAHDEVVLLYDCELDLDYRLLERVLSLLGPSVWRVPLGRVPIGGEIRSARQGGWQGYGVGDLLAATRREDHDDAVMRLGMRLYFIAMLGQGPREPFRHDLLRKALARAARLLAAAQHDATADPAGDLARHSEHAYIDPYRLTSGLFGKWRHAPAVGFLTEVYL